VALVHNNKLYVANAGDCKGIVTTVNEQGLVGYKKISRTFNANSKKEQARLKESFKDPDIYVCRSSGACYVKVISNF
jgi:serine/threonine protein phosphatase PrpC